jgi:hypothetical protein
MTAHTAQRGIAGIFLILGAWCLIAPQSVLTLGLRPEFQTDDLLASVLMGCFGAQAVLAGLFAAFSIFTRRTFLAFGIALLPFFLFDYWFYAIQPIFNELVLMDAVGNVIMLWLCWIGWRKAEA